MCLHADSEEPMTDQTGWMPRLITDSGCTGIFKLFAPWEIFQAFLLSADFFFQNQLFQKYHLSVKQIGPRSGPTKCWA